MKNSFFSRYRKFFVALLGAAMTAGTALADSGVLGDWGPVLIALITAVGVERIPNAKKYS